MNSLETQVENLSDVYTQARVAGHVEMKFWCGHVIHLMNADLLPFRCPVCHIAERKD